MDQSSVERITGKTVVERLGFLLTVLGLMLLVYWILAYTSVEDSWWLKHVTSTLGKSISCVVGRCRYEGPMVWGLRMLAAGLLLRYAVLPLWRWLSTGRIRNA